MTVDETVPPEFYIGRPAPPETGLKGLMANKLLETLGPELAVAHYARHPDIRRLVVVMKPSATGREQCLYLWCRQDG